MKDKNNIKEKMDNVKEESLKLMGIYFIVILITFITVILVYFIGLYKYNKHKNYDVQYFELKTQINDNEYELISLDDVYSLNEKCVNGCKFKTGSDVFTYYTIKFINGSYNLDIDLLYSHIKDYDLGNSITSLNIRNFNGYVTLYLTIINDVRSFDEVLVVDNNKVDTFVSFNANEIEFNNDEIIYYTYSCLKSDLGNAIKIKNTRKPFSDASSILGYEYINMNMC
ncbi:MAG: hypothetical protein IJS56_03320 [Bacilli bacterium]|nr:hypothetical protein [Bacilli bacterium]